MKKIVAFCGILGLVTGVLLIILFPSLLSTSFVLTSAWREVLRLPKYSYRSGSVAADSLMLVPSLCVLLGILVGWLLSKLKKGIK